MIGSFKENKGWEVLCDNLGLFVGNIHGDIDNKPNDEDYQILCEEIIDETP